MSAALPLDSQTTRFYEDHVRRYGYTYRALGFGRRSWQEKRFAAVQALGSFPGKRILDVGGGFGDLLAWLRARGIEPDYTGLDICKPMIERCRARFGRSAKFVIGDALTFVTDYTWDYIIASGIFGYNANDTRKRLQPTLERPPQGPREAPPADARAPVRPVAPCPGRPLPLAPRAEPQPRPFLRASGRR